MVTVFRSVKEQQISIYEAACARLMLVFSPFSKEIALSECWLTEILRFALHPKAKIQRLQPCKKQ